MSGKVHEEVRRKLDLSFVDGGAQQLKNIVDPVAVYHVRGDGVDEYEQTSAAQHELIDRI